MKKKTHENWFTRTFSEVNKAAFWTCLIISIGLMVGAFFVPPLAIIDASILAGTGELFGFAALGTVIEGIEKGRSVTIQKGETTMTLNDNDKDDENEIQ